jgi:two-component system LytT family response regulator
MQVAIIDDERNARLNINVLLQRYCPQIQVVGEADSVQGGLELLRSRDADLVLLDVEMLDGTGFDLLDAISPYNFQVVFVTAHESFAIKAFRYSAMDYILKPIDPNELMAAIDKASHWKQFENPGTVIPDLQNERIASKIKLSNTDGTFILDINCIMRLESFKNYTTFYLSNKEPILVSTTIGFYAEMLPDNKFYRTHQSHVVNLNYIATLREDNVPVLQMEDGTIVPIATRKREELRRKLKNTNISGL